MRFKTIVTLGTILLIAGCDKTPQPVAPADPAAATTDQAPAAAAPAGPVASAPVRQPEAAPARPQAVPQAAIESDDRDVPQQPVYTDYQPPLAQPQPIAAPWAPPPLIGEAVPPQPSPDATWTGGYWVWREQWVWAPGHWSRPPRPDYHWVPPYYEHRNDRVLFVDGFWSAPGVSFVRPAATLSIALAVVGVGIALGHPPIGPEGPFVPPPPGSRWGLIVPAPVGTSPYVVRGAPPIIAPGMRVTNNVSRVTNDVHNTTINRNSTVINNITNVTIEAPASSTSNHQAVHAVVSPQSHLVAGAPAVAPAPSAPPPSAAISRPPQPAPNHGAVARDADPRRPDPSRAGMNAMKPGPVDEPRPAPHAEKAAPTPRAPEPARPVEHESAQVAPKPAERPAAPAHPQPSPARTVPAMTAKPEAAHPAPPRDVHAAEAPHPPAHEVHAATAPHPPAHPAAQTPKEHPPAPHGEAHEAKEPGKEKDERR